MAEDGYTTLRTEGTSEVSIKGSRFLGWARPLSDVEDAMRMVEEARRRRPQANHHAFAYRLRSGGGVVYRSSDDGEPGGTAGRPILAVLDSRGVVDAAVVVSRFFGGVKLGTGGLARAYGRAARAAVDASGLRSVRLLGSYTLVVPIEHLGSVEALLHRDGIRLQGRSVDTERAMLRLRLATGDASAVREKVARATGGKAELRRSDSPET